MKGFGIWVLLLMVVYGTTLLPFSEMAFSGNYYVDERMGGMVATSRKLMVHESALNWAGPEGDRYSSLGENGKNDPSKVNLEDYRPYDPVPSSSKASVRPGPIQHGTPLMPYIPKPAPPPAHPKSPVISP